MSIAELQKSIIEKVSNTTDIHSLEKIQLFIDNENKKYYELSDTEVKK